MLCELCGYDLLFYCAASRYVEGLNICLGCYLELNESGYGHDSFFRLALQFLRRADLDTRRAASIGR